MENFLKERDRDIPHSVCILAMILNGLGFIGQRLYLFPEFFKNISTERLFGEGVTKEDLNQYVIGETLDTIVKYGPTKLFTEIVLHIMSRLPIPVQCLHGDTTSVSVCGDYDDEETDCIDIFKFINWQILLDIVKLTSFSCTKISFHSNPNYFDNFYLISFVSSIFISIYISIVLTTMIVFL